MTGAIKEAFTADLTLAALAPGGMWVEQVPETVGLDWVALRLVGGSIEWDSGGNGWEVSQIRFECYASGLADAETLAKQLCTTYDAVPSPVSLESPSRLLAMTRTSPKVPTIQETRIGDTQEVCFQVVVDYQAMAMRYR